MSTKRAPFQPRNNDPVIEFSDEEIIELRKLYKTGVLDYKTVPAILINSDKVTKLNTAGGEMLYVNPRILNIREYKKDNKKFVYSQFKFEKLSDRGLCLLNSNVNYPCEDKKDDKNNSKKDNKKEAAVDVDEKEATVGVDAKSIGGTMKFSYCYPTGIETYVDLTDEQLKTRLEEKYTADTKDADVIKRGEYVTKEMKRIKYCMPAYLRDTFISEAFVKSFKSEWNSTEGPYSYVKLFGSLKAYERSKDKLVVKTHSQEYVKIKDTDDETLDLLEIEQKKYTKLVETKGDLNTCNFGPGKKYNTVGTTNFRRLDKPIYHLSRKLKYITKDSKNGDYKIINGQKSSYAGGGLWDQLKLTYRDSKKVEHKSIAPDLFSTFKYAMTRDSLCQLTFTYQCKYSVAKQSITLEPKVTHISIIKREEPKSYNNDKESEENTSRLMNEFDDDPTPEDEHVADSKDEKEESKPATKQANKTKEEKDNDRKTLEKMLSNDE
jgi:hypothetical protein